MLVLFIFFLFEILLVCEIQKFGKALYVGQFQTKIYIIQFYSMKPCPWDPWQGRAPQETSEKFTSLGTSSRQLTHFHFYTKTSVDHHLIQLFWNVHSALARLGQFFEKYWRSWKGSYTLKDPFFFFWKIKLTMWFAFTLMSVTPLGFSVYSASNTPS